MEEGTAREAKQGAHRSCALAYEDTRKRTSRLVSGSRSEQEPDGGHGEIDGQPVERDDVDAGMATSSDDGGKT